MKKVVVGNEYFELVRRFPLRPIASASDLNAATAVIDDLIARESRTADEDAYLDVLSDVVAKYEAERHPIPDAADHAHRHAGRGTGCVGASDATGSRRCCARRRASPQPA